MLELSLAEAESVSDEEAESEELRVPLPEDVVCADDVSFSDSVGVAVELSLVEVNTGPDEVSELDVVS
jgi:hypothetical protein